MPQVPAVRTTLAPEEARELLQSALTLRATSRPEQASDTPQVLALLLALWDLETATGERQFGHNFGNQVATRPDTQDFFIADDSGNSRMFRSYPGFREGAQSFVNQVTSDTRPQWAAGLRTGDPVEFVRSLKGLNGGLEYFEANLERYQRGFLQRWERYRVDGQGVAPEPAPAIDFSPSDSTVAAAFAVIGSWLVYRVVKGKRT